LEVRVQPAVGGAADHDVGDEVEEADADVGIEERGEPRPPYGETELRLRVGRFDLGEEVRPCFLVLL
jgi:hypothetical protein